MITFFTIPKAFTGHFNIIQRNAIKSWKMLPIDCEILLFGNEVGTAEAAKEFGAKHVKELEVTSYGTPRIDYMFLKAQEIAANNFLCYINTDIILVGDFKKIINKLRKHSKDFLLIGQRRDLDIKEPLAFNNNWQEALIENANKNGRWYGPYGMDYFLFRKGLWKTIPPFGVGRTVWDPWLVYEARRQRASVIDATKCIHAIHQNHDYSHAMGGTQAVWKGEEAIRNLLLADGYRYCFTIMDATVRWQRNGWSLPGFMTLHFMRRFVAWIIIHPKLLAVIDLFWKRKKIEPK